MHDGEDNDFAQGIVVEDRVWKAPQQQPPNGVVNLWKGRGCLHNMSEGGAHFRHELRSESAPLVLVPIACRLHFRQRDRPNDQPHSGTFQSPQRLIPRNRRIGILLVLGQAAIQLDPLLH